MKIISIGIIVSLEIHGNPLKSTLIEHTKR